MEEIVMVSATAHLVLLAHGTEPIDQDELIEDLNKAINREASQFIACGHDGPGLLPPWIATVHRLDVDFERTRTVYIDLDNEPTGN